MEQRQLGHGGPQVSAIGLGCMSIGIADVYTSSVRDDVKAIELIHRALDLGLNFLDTANIYGDSEIKVGKSLTGRRDGVILATKFGIVTDSPVQDRGVDGTPENARRACDKSLERLGVEHIDLITCIGWIRKCRSRRPSARWRTWCVLEKYVISDSPRHRPRQCAVPIRFIRSPRSRRNIRCSVVSPKTVCCRSCVNSVSRWWLTVRWVADFSAAGFAPWMTSHATTGGVEIRVFKEKSSPEIFPSLIAYGRLRKKSSVRRLNSLWHGS